MPDILQIIDPLRKGLIINKLIKFSNWIYCHFDNKLSI